MALKLDDFDAAGRQIVIRESKGREPCTVPVSAEWVAVMQDWLKARQRLMRNAPEGVDEG